MPLASGAGVEGVLQTEVGAEAERGGEGAFSIFHRANNGCMISLSQRKFESKIIYHRYQITILTL